MSRPKSKHSVGLRRCCRAPGARGRGRVTRIQNGASDLYAALDVASGKVISRRTDKHRAVEVCTSLNLIDRSVPDDLRCGHAGVRVVTRTAPTPAR